MPMYVVTVDFEVAPDHAASFRAAVMAQAENSLRHETDCHQFDVCFDAERPGRYFLYEKYRDRAAFDAHLQSEHFKAFDAAVGDWVVHKNVKTWIGHPATR